MIRKLFTTGASVGMLVMTGAPAWALSGGRLAATQAIGGLATEFSGPLAYGISLAAVVGTAVSWYRHHGEFGHLAQAGLGTLFVGGIALGATSLLGFIPGVAGLGI
jgi:hypothetical protein